MGRRVNHEFDEKLEVSEKGALGADQEPSGQGGSTLSADDLMTAVYDELRGLARHLMRSERPGQTISATALVHEAYVRLSGRDGLDWKDDRHFYLAAAQAMRRILVDRARAKETRGRGGRDRQRVPLAEVEETICEDSVDFVILDSALRRLSLEQPRVAQVVMLRFFVGMSNEVAAGTLGISTATAARDWAFGRAWLYDALRDDAD